MDLQLHLRISQEEISRLVTDLVVLQTFGTSIDKIQRTLFVGVVTVLPITVVIRKCRIDPVLILLPIFVL